MISAVIFDFDNTIANTDSIRDIREGGLYDQLTPDRMRHVFIYSPVRHLLASLKESGVLIGLVTNAGTKYVETVLNHLTLYDFFDAIVTYSDVKREGMKPSPKGLQLALSQLGLVASSEILYIGDDNNDHVAAYRAGITPAMPSWASRKSVSTAPALEISSTQLLDYISDPEEYALFAEKCSRIGDFEFERKNVYFLPLDDSANVVTVREEMTCICLGRYFSQKSSITAILHDNHDLSTSIYKKEEQDIFEIPEYWPGLFTHVIRNAARFVFDSEVENFDIVSVIPSKKGKARRMERLLALIAEKMRGDSFTPIFLDNLFYFLDDAQSQKHLKRAERSHEVQRALHFNDEYADLIRRKRVLIIDDVTTTGSTIKRARDLVLTAGEASSAIGLVLAKTVSIMEDERPCPNCGRAMKVVKNKGNGVRFWGCTGYGGEDPCNHTESLIRKECPNCSRPMRVQTRKKDNVKFWSCTGFRETPSCNSTMAYDPDEALS